MPRFSYKAREKTGKLIKGVQSADSEDDLAGKLDSLGCVLVSSSEIREGKVAKVSGLSPKELINFSLNLGTLIKAGVSMLVSISDLAEQAGSKNIHNLLEGIWFRINSGSSFSDALKAYPQCFSKLYVGIVSAGEVTGKLDDTMEQLAYFLEWREELNSKIKSAMIYPILIIIFIIGLVILLTGFVMPKITPIFSAVGGNLPLSTRILLGLRDYVTSYWVIAVGTVAVFTVGLIAFIKTKAGRLKFDGLILKLPIVGTLFTKLAIMRFCQTLSIAIKSGVSIMQSLMLCEGVVNNTVISQEIKQVKESIEVGGSLAESIQLTKVFPRLIGRMISVGESTGTLDRMLDKINEFYVKDIDRTIKRVFTLIEPLLVVLMGCFVGFIAVSILLPIIQAALIVGE